MADRSNYPLWVRLGLWGLPTRRSVWAFVWISLLAAIVGSAYGFRNPRFFACILFVLPALMYWLTIRWVDNHGKWA
jgi:hypothetical protein